MKNTGNTNGQGLWTTLDLAMFLLILANLWIFSYQNLLLFLNHIYLPTVLSTNDFLTPMLAGVRPEPSEIPLYLVLTLSLSAIACYLIKKCNPFFALSSSIKWFLLIIFSFMFVCRLGPFPLPESASFLSFSSIEIFLAYTATVILLIIFLSRPFWTRNKKSVASLYFIVFSIIAFFLFEPGFPLSYFDSSFTLGPIDDMAHGKSLLIDTLTPSYGFLSIILLAFFAKYVSLHFNWLPVVIWIASVFEYFLYFYLFLKITKQLPFALISLFSLLTFHVFFAPWPILMYSQGTILRWAPIVFAYVFFFLFKDLHNKKYLFFMALFMLWSIDSGLYVLTAYGLSLVMLALKQKQSLMLTIKRGSFIQPIKSLSLLFLFIISIYLALGGLLYSNGYAWISPHLLFVKLIQYARAGFMMEPIPFQTFFWLIPFLYLTVITTFCKKKVTVFEDNFVIYATNLMFCQAIYYVGRSFYLNLMYSGVFFLITLFLFIGRYWKVPKSTMIYLILCCLFILIPAWYAKDNLHKVLSKTYHAIRSGSAFTLAAEVPPTYSSSDLKLIQSIPDKKIIILAWGDTYLLNATHKVSLIGANPQYAISTKQELDQVVKKMDYCPKAIIVAKTVYYPQPLKFCGGFVYQFLLLKHIEHYCHTTYKKISCASTLCLAASP